VSDLAVDDAVWALAGFDRNGAAAEYTSVPASFLAPKPHTLGHVESASIPLAGLTAWQGLFEHGRLRKGERVLIHGAAGGVGQVATQLAHWRGAHVIGTGSSSAAVEDVLALGADEVVDRTGVRFEEALAPVDLVLHGRRRGARTLKGCAARGGRLVSVAEEPPSGGRREGHGDILPRRAQPSAARRARPAGRRGAVQPAIDSVFRLGKARAAFDRVMMRGKRGKVILQIGDD
jgi:NADPH:quinone reductase-like Zn-dependent oxidoreductase